MAKFIKVTDLTGREPHIGYHSVVDNFELPLSTKNTKFEFVDEKEARENHPGLFGPAEEKPIEGTKKAEKVNQ